MGAYEKYILPAIFGISYIAFALLIHQSTLKFIRKATANMLKPMDQADMLQETVLKSYEEIPQASTLVKQFQLLGHMKTYYRQLAVSYYQNYYVFAVCSIVYAGFSAIAIFGYLPMDGKTLS